MDKYTETIDKLAKMIDMLQKKIQKLKYEKSMLLAVIGVDKVQYGNNKEDIIADE